MFPAVFFPDVVFTGALFVGARFTDAVLTGAFLAVAILVDERAPPDGADAEDDEVDPGDDDAASAAGTVRSTPASTTKPDMR